MFQKQSYSLRLAIEKVSIRERYLMLIVLAALVLLMTQGLLMLTNYDKHDFVIERIEQKKQETDRIKQALVDYQAAINNPRIIALQNSNQNLKNSIDILEQRIGEINDKLMSPDRMVELLKELLDKQSNLTVLNFSVLPVKTIESNIEGGGSLFYQHGIELQLEGEFEALTAYLAQIESLKDQMFWDDLEITTETFPVLNIQLKVHTLSQDEEWLNV